MMIERSVIDAVKNRTDLADLVGQYVPLRRAGRNFVARCPFHDERTPSFNVNADRGLVFCFGCKWSGDALRFRSEMEGESFVESLRVLAERAGVEIPDDRDPERIAEDRRQRDVSTRLHAACEAAAVFYERCLRDMDHPFSDLAREALVERGITGATADTFRLGYAPARWDGLAEHLRASGVSPADAELAGLLVAGRNGHHYDRFRHRLMFPVHDRGGNVIAFSGRVLPQREDIPEGLVPADAGKYVNSPETPIFSKGATLYGLATARMAMRQKAEAVLVEGNFDVVQMHQQGFTNIAAPLGTSFTAAQAKLLRRFAETVWLVFDGDDAGRRAARTAQPVCAEAGLVTRVGVLPPKSDPDSFLRGTETDEGTAGMRRVIALGPGIVEWLIRDTAASAGDTVPERVASLRVVAPVIATVTDPIERSVYIDLVAQYLTLETSQVHIALREHANETKRTVRESLYVDDARKRPGLTGPVDMTVDPVQKRRMAIASAIEAVLLYSELLALPDAETLEALVDEKLRPMIAELRRQWKESQHIDGPSVLDLAPDDRVKHWVASRLIANAADSEDQGFRGHSADTLRDDVVTLQRLIGSEAARAMKAEHAKLGVQGDTRGERRVLSEQHQLRREIARMRPINGGKR